MNQASRTLSDTPLHSAFVRVHSAPVFGRRIDIAPPDLPDPDRWSIDGGDIRFFLVSYAAALLFFLVMLS